MSRPTVTDLDNPVWTTEDFGKSQPASALPPHIQAAFPKTRGQQKTPTKVPVSIRLSPEVIQHFKAGGPGWQSRIDAALRKAAGV